MFKQFAPLNKLNMGLLSSEVFESEKNRFPLERSPRYKKFVACTESFRRYLLSLNYILDRVASHFSVTYNKKDRQNIDKNRVVRNTVLLSVDLDAFFITMKILLDHIAFFTPFYYKEPLKKDKKDARDLKFPWSFRSMKKHFLNNHEDFDPEFNELLLRHLPWMDDICDTRDFLVHRFHDFSIGQDYWTQTCFAFLYELFNEKKDFIPDILSYIAKIYFEFTKFLKDYEVLFKNKCEMQFSSFRYFYEGNTYANRLDRTHLFFAALGRVLKNKILIRIHPNRRNIISNKLEEIMKSEKCICIKCKSYKFQIKSTVEEYILISAQCACGNPLSIPFIVEKKFFPYFMDQNQRNVFWGLIPYTLDKQG